MEWTKEQIEYLQENYPKIGKKNCIESMGLKECQVRYMASKLRLKVDSNSLLLNIDNAAKGHFKGKKRPSHSVKMKQLIGEGKMKQFIKRDIELIITECLVCGNKIETYMPKNSTLLYRIRKTCSNKCRNILLSKNTIELQKTNGHPRGMKGKTHSDENKEKMSVRTIEMWKDPNSKFNTEEHSQKQSDRNVLLHKTGILGGNTSYSNCKRSWFIDGEKRYFMRSGWEIRYAAFLNILVSGNEILKWEYEIDTFWFESIKRGVRSYKPDFKVYNKDGTVEYHEVKGQMDSKSKTKLNRMRIYYPEIKIILKDQTFFKNARNIIPSYEHAIKQYS